MDALPHTGPPVRRGAAVQNQPIGCQAERVPKRTGQKARVSTVGSILDPMRGRIK